MNLGLSELPRSLLTLGDERKSGTLDCYMSTIDVQVCPTVLGTCMQRDVVGRSEHNGNSGRLNQLIFFY